MRDNRSKALPFGDLRSMKRRATFAAGALLLAAGAFYASKSAVAHELPAAGAAVQAVTG
ncbi:hypothetical protein [Acidovorax sp. SUPP2539]|uniref:hypothetical protein n=1 Tax=Acidovorax sp. SUPP2539 TaxID=2920878 RepID=UPI0023DE5342|nr:hypothetical protein [Acidovorax sp. SUPP2539]GKS88509.1 hypothetical protein AVTE2539_04110 [Acidovorax sp. SUPP2539]